MDIQVNFLAVLLAGVSTMVVGSIWYSMSVFGPVWSKLAKVDMKREQKGNQIVVMLGLTFLASLVTAYAVANITYVTNQFLDNSYLKDALGVGFWVWLGFVALRMMTHDLFEGRPAKLTLLNAAHEFVTIMVIALIIGLFGV